MRRISPEVRHARKTAAPNKVLIPAGSVWLGKHSGTPVGSLATSISGNRGMRNILILTPYGSKAHNMVLADHGNLRLHLQSPEGQQQAAQFGREHAFVKVGMGGSIIGTNRPSVFDGHQLVPVNPDLVRRLGYENRANKAIAAQDAAAAKTRAWVEPMARQREARLTRDRERRLQELPLFNPRENPRLARARK